MTLDFDRLREALECQHDGLLWHHHDCDSRGGFPLCCPQCHGSGWAIDDDDLIGNAARLLLGAEKRWECRDYFGDVFARCEPGCGHDQGGWRLSIPLEEA